MHDEEAASLLEPLPEDERFASWHLALGDGSLVGYGTGGVELLRSMRLTRPVGGLFAAVPDRLLDAAYGLVARHRDRLGRLVPNGPAPKRFP